MVLVSSPGEIQQLPSWVLTPTAHSSTLVQKIDLENDSETLVIRNCLSWGWGAVTWPPHSEEACNQWHWYWSKNPQPLAARCSREPPWDQDEDGLQWNPQLCLKFFPFLALHCLADSSSQKQFPQEITRTRILVLGSASRKHNRRRSSLSLGIYLSRLNKQENTQKKGKTLLLLTFILSALSRGTQWQRFDDESILSPSWAF